MRANEEPGVGPGGPQAAPAPGKSGPVLFGRRGFGGAVERRLREALAWLLARLPGAASSGAPPQDARALLLLRIDRVGDMIVSTPAIRAIRRRFPDAEIRVVASKGNAAILKGNPDVDAVHTLSPRGLPALARQLLRRWDVAADLNSGPSLTSGLLTRLARARHSVSFAKKNAELFYGARLAGDESAHRAEETMKIARWLGAAGDDLRYAVYPSPEDARTAEDALRRAGWSPGAAWVAVHPGNIKKYDNRWPEEKFGDLCARLRARAGVDVLLLQGFDEAPLIERVRRHCSAPLKALPALSLLATAEVLRRMRLVVCNSTSTLHLAAAVGAPTVSLLSGYSFQCWRALGAEHRALTCGTWNSCRDISVEAAEAAVKEAL